MTAPSPIATHGSSLRERKKAATEATLRDAAIELCSEGGPDAFTIDDICRRANVARRTFFNYFPRKRSAIIGWGTTDHARIVHLIVSRSPDEDPLTAVEAVLCDHVGSTTEAPLWARQVVLLAEYPTLREQFSEYSRDMEASVAQGISLRTGISADDIRITMLAAVMAAAVRTTLTAWFNTDATSDVRKLFTAHVSVLREGFTDEKSTIGNANE
ncbi:TetR/AcrR family transcriptional regulator [Mycobacterium sp. 94-17]|uniref:TetR/AcrR family transcriptional regulator n=1 Tax=Mycobacterium sp. 94-17 TaxID=2986147 RepID=UPI002D1E9464|nr:TetR family transcriptional regulator [Mycobacterium sp. 94-17]MEB4211755.1 TetR family transcriptional regulator [Mycobacterium sp. 94-17]